MVLSFGTGAMEPSFIKQCVQLVCFGSDVAFWCIWDCGRVVIVWLSVCLSYYPRYKVRVCVLVLSFLFWYLGGPLSLIRILASPFYSDGLVMKWGRGAEAALEDGSNDDYSYICFWNLEDRGSEVIILVLTYGDQNFLKNCYLLVGGKWRFIYRGDLEIFYICLYQPVENMLGWVQV